MLEELNALKAVSGDIANQIRDVTNNVRIGFGSFNDKVTRPYTYFPVPRTAGIDCPQQIPCGPNYAFSHQITLTDNITFYNMALQGVDTTANADLPENGLEGLAQVLACERIIGWRNRNTTSGLTRVVLFMTDDAFHYAGEGQFAGILKPYRGECLLDPPPSNAGSAGATEFTRWREVDYPSVGQIVQMLQQKEVAVIFAIAQARLDTYRNLSRLINLRSRASVAQLEENGASILRLIDREYRHILREVALVPDDSTELDISIRSMCPNDTVPLNEETGCDNVQLQQSVDFEINVTLNSCENFPTTSSAARTHRIVSPGFGDFTITYTGDCMCDCARNLNTSSPDCSGNGDFVCGICECHEGWCGATCNRILNTGEEDEMCSRGGLNDEICSGPQRGVCRCSVCECFDSYSGPACECDGNDTSCPRNANNEQCSGQGDCCEGRCRCTEDANGHQYRHNGTTENCACPPREVVCNLKSDTECSGNGRCGCNRCICNSGFFGDFCQSRDVGTCGNSMDIHCIEQCVNASFNADICRSCEHTRPLIVVKEELPDNNLITYLEGIANMTTSESFTYELDCEITINNNCTYDYYLLRGSQMYVFILVEKPAFCRSDLGSGGINLPFEPYIFAPIIFGVLLILGIIIFVLAKIIIFVLDYMEVKRLDKETKGLDFSMNRNPLYQSPDMKYDNVAYGCE